MAARERGDGSLYQREATGYWWLKYYVHGRPVRESSHTRSKTAAKGVLRQRLNAIAAGTFVAPDEKRATYADLVGLVRLDYQNKQRRSADRAERAFTHLAGLLGAERTVAKDAAKGTLAVYAGGARAHTITTTNVESYKATRIEAKAAPATVDYELAVLRRMYRLAFRRRLVREMPEIELFHVPNARAGFLERTELDALCAHLAEDVAPVVRFAFTTGWRLRSEVLPLTWDRVDLTHGTVRLEPGTTKDGKARTFPFADTDETADELRTLLVTQRERTTAIERQSGSVVRWVFHREGQRIRSIRWAWQAACKAAGLGGRIPHDLRRSAVRDLERGGVSRSVAMALVGHRTQSMYERYAITCEADQREGARKLAALRAKDAKAPKTALPFPIHVSRRTA